MKIVDGSRFDEDNFTELWKNVDVDEDGRIDQDEFNNNFEEFVNKCYKN